MKKHTGFAQMKDFQKLNEKELQKSEVGILGVLSF